MKFNNENIRRQDRTLDEKRAFEILKEGEYGVLSMQSEDGQGAYGIPLSYVWDRGNSIYIHCAPIGRKLNCIDRCQQVSFCVVGRTKVIPNKFTTAYESVVMKEMYRPSRPARRRTHVRPFPASEQVLSERQDGGYAVCREIVLPHRNHPVGHRGSERQKQSTLLIQPVYDTHQDQHRVQ